MSIQNLNKKSIKSNSINSKSRIDVVLYEDDDSVDSHTEDIYKASRQLANKENINFISKYAEENILR